MTKINPSLVDTNNVSFLKIATFTKAENICEERGIALVFPNILSKVYLKEMIRNLQANTQINLASKRREFK